jgi:hypothetical protein
MMRTIIRSLVVAVATTLVAAAGFSEVQPGDQSRWSLDFLARMEQSSAQPIEIHMSGEWISTVAAVRAREYDAQLQLAHVDFKGDAVKHLPESSLADFRTRLSRPFWATFRSDGALVSMHFFRDQAPSDRNLLQMIATELQIVRSSQGRTSWTAQERDGAGEYSALYLMAAPDRILKRKLKYLHTDGVAGAPVDAVGVVIEVSDITFRLAPNGEVEQIDGAERVRMELSQKQSEQLTAFTEFHAGNRRTGRGPELIGSLDRKSLNVIHSPIVSQKPSAEIARAEADDRLLSGDTTQAILASAFAKGAPTAPVDRLTALFRRRPDAPSAAVAILKKEGPRRSVTNALGAAGSPSAIAALNTLAHNSALSENLRVDAIIAFVQMPHPTVEAMRGPGDLMDDPNQSIQSAARMMSGALSHAGRQEHGAEADAIDTSLIALYRSARDTHDKIQLLGALGNSAGPLVVPVVEEALHEPAVAIRAAAARALRLAPGSEVDQILATAMINDKDATVRADAIFAARFRHPLAQSLADALIHAAGADPSNYVRSDAIAVLRQNPSASPQIPETLERIAQLDADAGIRRQAKEAVAAFSPQGSTVP